MSDYIPKKTPLPRHIYKMTLQLLRGYDYIKREANELAYQGTSTGGIRGADISNPTHNAAVRRLFQTRALEAMDKAKDTVPPEYRDVAFISLKDNAPIHTISGGQYASPDTWTKYRQQIIYYTALYMGWYEEWR